MQTPEEIKATIEQKVPGARVELVPNGLAGGLASLLIDNEHALAVVKFLRDAPELAFDYASNTTGLDWPERVIKDKIKVKKTVDGLEKEVEETSERKTPAYLEVVHHLYSMRLSAGPLTLRLRTGDRGENIHLPSFTPVWRSCEFQEREIFDLFGIVFDGHPDLRRLLMWEGFKDYPMRRDYVEPDDYEYEPTPHDDVLEKAQRHFAQEGKV